MVLAFTDSLAGQNNGVKNGVKFRQRKESMPKTHFKHSNKKFLSKKDS